MKSTLNSLSCCGPAHDSCYIMSGFYWISSSYWWDLANTTLSQSWVLQQCPTTYLKGACLYEQNQSNTEIIDPPSFLLWRTLPVKSSVTFQSVTHTARGFLIMKIASMNSCHRRMIISITEDIMSITFFPLKPYPPESLCINLLGHYEIDMLKWI